MANKKKRLLGIDDLWQFERLGPPSLSPDGAQVVLSVTRHSMEDNKASASLWLLSTFGGAPRRLTACGEKDGQAAWSPRGDRIAFLARREQEGRKDETPQLYLIAPDGGEARRVSDFAPGIEAFRWLPDGRRIAFVAWVWPDRKGTKAQAKAHKAFKERKETGYATSEALWRYWDHNIPMGRAAHLHLLDVETGRITDLFESRGIELPRTEPDANVFDVSPDGRRIVFAFDAHDEQRIDHTHALGEVDLKRGTVRTLLRDDAWDFAAPRFSPDGRRLAFVAAHQGLKHTMPGRLAVAEADGSGWQSLSDDWDHDVSGPLRWSEDGASICFTAEARARHPLWRFTLATRQAEVLVPGGWVHGFEQAGGVTVTVADSLDHPPRAHAHRAGETPRRLETFNDALLARFDFGAHEDLTIRGAQGDDVQMWVVYPPGFDRKKKYPILHSIHGGPHAASADTFHWRWNAHVFAAQGYVVAAVNYHGSSGFGYAFLDSITHRWGQLELQDVEAATDHLLRQPWADPQRVFASGGSYGGYMVAWMNAHVPAGRYRAYVCHAGCFDWVGMFAEDAYTWFPRELGASYWEDMGKVHAQSPHAFVAGMATPTLVVHGALDYRVPDAQGLAYYNTLKARGIDARLLWFPDENHWILKPRNSRLWYEEFFAWLKRHDARPRKRVSARS